MFTHMATTATTLRTSPTSNTRGTPTKTQTQVAIRRAYVHTCIRAYAYDACVVCKCRVYLPCICACWRLGCQLHTHSMRWQTETLCQTRSMPPPTPSPKPQTRTAHHMCCVRLLCGVGIGVVSAVMVRWCVCADEMSRLREQRRLQMKAEWEARRCVRLHTMVPCLVIRACRGVKDKGKCKGRAPTPTPNETHAKGPAGVCVWK